MANGKTKVSIIGATGYVGVELLRSLCGHPHFEISKLVSKTFAGKKFSDIYPIFRGIVDVPLSDITPEEVAADSDIVITALPHGVSSKIVPELLSYGVKVLDHSGDFRYQSLARYESSYGLTHPHPELLNEAVYGLPELYREELKSARLISDPGCYPTCSILGLTPLLHNGLIKTEGIIVDAVSGVSGAGRKADLAYAFCEEADGFKPYGVVGHRHTTEIEEKCAIVAGLDDIKITFTPHLASFVRGMLCTIYVDPNEKGMSLSTDALNDVYSEYYKDEHFVRVLSGKEMPDVRHVSGTNFAEINLVKDEYTGKIKVFSAIDNLGKGSSMQAIQAMNVAFGYDEGEGINTLLRGV